jgi:benzylsuccinate CoA-transferase BbsF subunit
MDGAGLGGLKPGLFKGLTITSFSWAIVGPLTMKLFADYGATVIRVETTKRPCTLRISTPYKDGQPGLNRSGYFNHFSANIYSMTLNMEKAEAVEVAKRLVAASDVVMENFTPGVMDRWGLTYETLKQVKPDIIMLRQSGFGPEGPYARQPAFGMILAALAGLPNFNGWAGGPPLPVGVSPYTDCISPRFAAASLIAALLHRKKTGEGQLLDLSQFETTLYYILPALLDYNVNGQEPPRLGNASATLCPHGVYPCQGEDRWCAMAVTNDSEWNELCCVIGQPEMGAEKRYATFAGRKQSEDKINAVISEWTARHTPEEVTERLQAAGVPAGVVMNVGDVYNDPQLRERGLFWPMEHPEMGTFTHLGPGFRLSKTPAQPSFPAPLIGEHTEKVCTGLLGMSDEEFVRLLADGVFE